MSMTTLEKARLREREAEIERIRETTLRAVGNNTADGANDLTLKQSPRAKPFEFTSAQLAAWEAAWRQLHGYDKEQSK